MDLIFAMFEKSPKIDTGKKNLLYFFIKIPSKSENRTREITTHLHIIIFAKKNSRREKFPNEWNFPDIEFKTKISLQHRTLLLKNLVIATGFSLFAQNTENFGKKPMCSDVRNR